MRRLTILGATGTIGENTLDVVRRNRDRYTVFALTANVADQRLAALCAEWQPRYAVLADHAAAARLAARVAADAPHTTVLAGPDALAEVAAASEVDAVMAGIVGAAGLLPTLAAARAGKRVLLANKEALVMSGALFMDAVREGGAELLPIDSEHNAIFQCMPVTGSGCPPSMSGVRRILLTGSGGPFRDTAIERLGDMTPDQACAHPNWVMGRKISVDSATMMNKGLELIEACWLFATDVERIEVVIHPQSIVHSMVEYLDGSVVAELGNPDMRTPIAHALAWPERSDSGVGALDLIAAGHLDFAAPDFARFPCLALGYAAARAGGGASTVLNAANEVAVAAFLDGRIRFTAIGAIIEEVLGAVDATAPRDIDAVLAIDAEARAAAGARLSRFAA